MMRTQTPFSQACKRALVHAARENEYLTSEAIKFHLNGCPRPETAMEMGRVMGGALRSGVSDGLLEATGRFVRVAAPGRKPGTGSRRQTVYHSLIYAPKDDEDNDE